MAQFKNNSDKALEGIPELTGSNYSIWISKMTIFLRSKKLLDVCLNAQFNPDEDMESKMNDVLLYLSAKVDNAIFNSSFPDPISITPHEVWTHLAEKYASKTIYSIYRCYTACINVKYTSTMTNYLDDMEKTLNEFKIIGIDVLQAVSFLCSKMGWGGQICTM